MVSQVVEYNIIQIVVFLFSSLATLLNFCNFFVFYRPIGFLSLLEYRFILQLADFFCLCIVFPDYCLSFCK